MKDLARREFIRKALMAGAGVAAVPFLSACGQSDEKEKPGAEVTDKKLYEGQSIHVVAFKLSGMDGVKERLPEFEERYNIKVDLEELQIGAARQKMLADFSGGAKTIDVSLSSVHFTPYLIAKGEIEPIDHFINSELAEPELLALDDFSPLAIENCTFPENVLSGPNRKWGLPHDLLVQALLYRKSLYDKLRLNVPETLEEYLQNAEAITKSEKGVFGSALRALKGPQIIWAWGAIFRACGGSYFVDYPKDLQPALDSQEFMESVKWFSDSFNYAPKGARAWGYTEVMSGLMNGSVAQTIDDVMFTNWLNDPQSSKTVDDWDYALIPLKSGLNHSDIKWGPSVSMSNHWVINKDIAEAKKQAAFKFIQWATSKPVLTALTREGKMKGVLTRNSQYELKKDEPWAQIHYKSQTYAHKLFRPSVAEWLQLEEELATRISTAVLGEMTPQEAARETQKSWTNILKKAGYI